MFTCALLVSGELRCWGNNDHGQLGDGTSEHRSIPTPVLGLPDGDEIVQLSSGGRHTNVLLASGRIMAWGLGDRGQLGNGQVGADYEEHSPVEVVGIPDGWKYLSGGYSFTCAIQEDDAAYCWGSNDMGQLGTGTLDNASQPAPVTGLSGVATMTSGSYHACAIDTAGALWCWGRNDRGQLGNPTAASPSVVPVQVDGLTGRVTDVACGVLHTCALLQGGEVWCWGTNEYGQLGNGSGVDSAVPVRVSPLPMPVQDLDSGYEHTCGLLESGGMICWGHNDEGQIGESGAGEIVSQPVFIEDLFPGEVVGMATGAFHTCALLDYRTVMCWGSNAFGELGNGSNESTTVPTQVRCE
jgi:alpha-tubulin suppressor-like RCC1 family protein